MAGECTIYPTATKAGTSSEPGIVSGGPVVEPASAIKLYPSWPASSPWVTAVGATRFVNQRPLCEEMVSDAFGSGGGFSKRFSQSDAPWQECKRHRPLLADTSLRTVAHRRAVAGMQLPQPVSRDATVMHRTVPPPRRGRSPLSPPT